MNDCCESNSALGYKQKRCCIQNIYTERQDKAELKKIIINQCQMAKLAIILLLAWFLRYRMRPFMACILKKYHRETEHHVNQQSPAKGTTQINSIP